MILLLVFLVSSAVASQGFRRDIATLMHDHWEAKRCGSIAIISDSLGFYFSDYVKILNAHGVLVSVKDLPKFTKNTLKTHSKSVMCAVFFGKSVSKLFPKARSYGYLDRGVAWLIPKINNCTGVRENLDEVGINADITIACFLAKSNEWDLVQAYKLNKVENSSITVHLGTWNILHAIKNSMPNFIGNEGRKATLSQKLIVGLKNESAEGNLFQIKLLEDEELYLFELMAFIFSGMNISYETLSFSKLGVQNDVGEWTHLLGAVAIETVDVGLVLIATDQTDFEISQPILNTMSNIYLKSPFTNNLGSLIKSVNMLLICYLLVIVALLVIGMFIVANYEFKNGSRRWYISESALWVVSVLCMQGSIWAPKSLPGSIILLSSLFFTVVTYNTYAAFVTSVTSVKINRIRSIQDLFDHNFKCGYTIASDDELFLRTVNNTLLREYYYRGLVTNAGSFEAESGILRTTTEDHYAFFGSVRRARRLFNAVLTPRARCQMQELRCKVADALAGLPVAKHSEYKDLIKYWLLRAREHGILRRLQDQLIPMMPNCNIGSLDFNGVKLREIIEAFYVFSFGFVLSLLVFSFEFYWKNIKFRNSNSTLTKFYN